MYPNLKQNIANNNVHFQPIQPAQTSPLQPEDRLLFDPLHQPSSTSSGSQTTTGSGFVHTPSPRLPQQAVPPTPYVNQTAVDQHAKTTQSLQTQPAKTRRQSITLLQEERRTLFPSHLNLGRPHKVRGLKAKMG